MASRFFDLKTTEAPENKAFFDFCWTNRRPTQTRRAPMGPSFTVYGGAACPKAMGWAI
jgi:hypothetical protein